MTGALFLPNTFSAFRSVGEIQGVCLNYYEAKRSVLTLTCFSGGAISISLTLFTSDLDADLYLEEVQYPTV